jgi:hypothetical protein
MAVGVRLVPMENKFVELQAFGNLGELHHRHHVMMQMAATTASTPLLRADESIEGQCQCTEAVAHVVLMCACVPTACREEVSREEAASAAARAADCVAPLAPQRVWEETICWRCASPRGWAVGEPLWCRSLQL